MTNIQKLFATPYGDNLVARCDNCGKPVFKCVCDDDEDDELDLMQHDYMREMQEQDTDGFGRNYSDADPGL